MKKSIRPPENWQDFESLCKKLFGELWNCAMKIKKNGRQGQPQAGIDIYGIPEGKAKYWGIQCKGKDNYTNSKLTVEEIDKEIKNAKSFKPELETFIFCTTSVKNSKIEEYIRIKDLENRSKGGFEILLYSWEDIVDFIDENRNTYTWYVDKIQFTDKYDVDIKFYSNDDSDIVKPKFERITTKFKKNFHNSSIKSLLDIYAPTLPQIRPLSLFESNEINHSWCNFNTVIINSGSSVIEDWKFYLFFDKNVRKIDDGFINNIMMDNYRTTFAYEEDNTILYSPLNEKPLIQKDNRQFKSYFIPRIGIDEINISWQLLARDFSREGIVTFKVQPEYENRKKTIWIDPKEEEREEEEIIEYIETKKSS